MATIRPDNFSEQEFHRLLDEGLEAVKTNSARPAKDVFDYIETKFNFKQSE